MNTTPTCLGVPELRDHAAGRLAGPRSRVVREHLANCPRCRGVMEGLEATHKDPAQPGEVGWSETDMAATITASYHSATGSFHVAPDEPAFFDPRRELDEDLAFLEPSNKPGSIGRVDTYEILGVLGRGGMGIVLKAFDEKLHRMVAIKLMAPKLASRQGAPTRFLQEARAAAAINDPNVVTIHSVGTHQGWLPYLVMECVVGGSLRERLRSGPPLEQVEVLRIGLQVARGLAAAHAQELIHRDIKPANILLENGIDRVKITDFGLALAGVDSEEASSQNRVVGTPSYMSPEQVQGLAVDARSDLFSLGCVLYAMVAGGSPFRGMHPLDVARKVNDLDPIPPHEVNPAVSRALSDLIMRLLAKKAVDRPASAEAVATELRVQLAAANQTTRLGGLEETTMLPKTRRRPTTRRVRRGDILIGLAALILLFVAGILLREALRPDRHRNDVTEKQKETTPDIPKPGSLITVARNGTARARSLSEAQGLAGPGSTIRVIDGSTYTGPLRINNRRWRGVTIEATNGAVLQTPGEGSAVILIDGVPDVTVRGFRVQSTLDQFAARIMGDSSGTTLDRLTFVRPQGVGYAQVLIDVGAHGTPEKPIRVRRSSFQPGGLGILLLGDTGRPVTDVVVEENRFEGTDGKHLELLQAVQRVVVRHNVFVQGRGMTFNLELPDQSDGVLVANNTFFGCNPWTGPENSLPEQGSIDFANNLIVGSPAIDVPDHSLARLARRWLFRNNVWEPGAGVGDMSQADRLARIERDLPFVSRKPTDQDFLRPSADSPLRNLGAGGDLPPYVGALEPARVPAADAVIQVSDLE